MFINTNVAALNAQRHVFDANRSVDRSLERLSSGLRINSGADDASGLAMAEKMAAQNAGLAVASQNAQDGQALYKIAEGALAQVSAMLTRMEELAVRATNGTLTSSDRGAILDEVDELRDQINRISGTTEYNTLKVLNGSLAVETHLNAVAVTNQGSCRIVEKPGTLRNARDIAFAITAVAQPAQHASGANSSALSISGTIVLNGVEIALAAGDSIHAVQAKINAHNEVTGVVALIDSVPAGDSYIDLLTGRIDADALNVKTGFSDVVAYALLGADRKIVLGGNGTLLTEIGHPGGGTWSGSDAAGTINGVAMEAVDGTKLKDVTAGSATEGLVIETDVYNGGLGAVLRNEVDINDYLVSRSTVGDTFTVGVDVDDRLRLQIGANYDQRIQGGIDCVNTAQLGIGGSSKFSGLDNLELDTIDHANLSLKVIRKAIEDVAAVRSKIGATMNRLDHTIKTLSVQRENMTSARSRIQDADISAEMTAYTKRGIMLQAGTAMLAQANARPQAMLQLLS